MGVDLGCDGIREKVRLDRRLGRCWGMGDDIYIIGSG